MRSQVYVAPPLRTAHAAPPPPTHAPRPPRRRFAQRSIGAGCISQSPARQASWALRRACAPEKYILENGGLVGRRQKLKIPLAVGAVGGRALDDVGRGRGCWRRRGSQPCWVWILAAGRCAASGIRLPYAPYALYQPLYRQQRHHHLHPSLLSLQSPRRMVQDPSTIAGAMRQGCGYEGSW